MNTHFGAPRGYHSLLLSGVAVGILVNTLVYPIFEPDHGILLTHNRVEGFSFPTVEAALTAKYGGVHFEYGRGNKGVVNKDLLSKLPSLYSHASFRDSQEHFRMAMGETDGMPPYKWRLLYPLLIKNLSRFWFNSSDVYPVHYTVAVLNTLMVVSIVMVIINTYGSESIKIATLLAGYVATAPGIIKTIPTLLIEIPSVLLMSLVIFAIVRRRFYLLGPIAVLMILTKEGFTSVAAPLFLLYWRHRNVHFLIAAAVLVIGFVGIRLWFGDDSVRIVFGNVTQGEFRLGYFIAKTNSLSDIVLWGGRLLVVLFPLVCGICIVMAFGRFRMLGAHVAAHLEWYLWIGAFVLAGMFLSGRPIRPWALLSPIVVYLCWDILARGHTAPRMDPERSYS